MPKKTVAKKEENLKDRVVYQWDGKKSRPKKTFWWFFIVSFIAAASIAFFYFNKDWFSIAVAIIVVPILFWYVKSNDQGEEHYRITPLGIFVNETLYPFGKIHSFWIVYDQKIQVLYFDFLQRYLPAVTLDLKNADPVLLRAILKRVLPEQEKRGESFLDFLVRSLGL